MKLLDMFGIAKEAIDFQNKAFGAELENVIQSIVDEKITIKEIGKCEQNKILTAIVKKYTNFNINFILDSKDSPAAVDLPIIHKNHLFFHNEIREYLDITDTTKIFDRIKDVKEKHTVSLKTGKVTGIFATLETPIHLNIIELLGYKMSVKQIVAVLLHEIGHLFTLYEFISRETSTNQILAGVFKSVINKDNIKDKEVIFEKAGKLLGGDNNTFKELVSQNDLKVITAVIYKEHVEHTNSELGTEHYDYTTCEQLADQYATRQGYGRDLIEALDLLTRSYVNGEQNKFLNIYINFAATASTIVILFTTIYLVIIGSVNLLTFISCFFLFSVLFGSGSSRVDFTYDILKTRYLRIKEQMVERLKNKKIDANEAKIILENINKIDVIIKQTYEQRLPLDRMFDYLFSKDKTVRKSIELQRDLESLAMNDFFVKSATLSTI
jgi:hypothetical protein